MLDIDKRIKESETRISKAVFLNTTNHYDTLFGGTAWHLMDEVSFICATRFSRKKVVSMSTDKIDFKKAIPQGSIIELAGNIAKVGNKSSVRETSVYMEDMYSYSREKVVTGTFTFVAIDDDKKPTSII